MKDVTDSGFVKSVCLSKCFRFLLIPVRVLSSYPLLFMWIKTGTIFGLFFKHNGFMLKEGV